MATIDLCRAVPSGHVPCDQCIMITNAVKYLSVVLECLSSSLGWKGTLMGVAMATVEAMVRNFGCRARDIVVAVGPSVGACCFRLDRQQALDFLQVHQDCVPDPESTRPHVDIRLANR